ncbi:MAG TPA: PAS domain-containing sensor histidine kinase, partial [Chromatiales bacterium]|nr:PAS domain-containing sensor histidine kinase [Chromatiales bacterium]
IPRNGDDWQLAVHCSACGDDNLGLIKDLAKLFSSDEEGPVQSATELMERRIAEVSNAINQLRTAHGLLHRTTEQMSDALIVADSGGNILLANKAALRYADGLTEESSLARRHLIELIHHIAIEGTTSWEEVFSRVMQGHIRIHFEGRHISGTEVFVQISPWVDEGGRFSGMVIGIADISFMKQSERKRAEALSFLSHDLRSPLTSLLSLVELHRQQSAHIKPEEFPDHVEMYTKKAMKLADGFLQMARAENVTPDNFHKVEFIGIVHNAIDDGYSNALEKGIQLQRHIPVDEAWVHGGASLLERALYNLIHNAIQYSPENSQVEVRISLKRDKVECCIEDQGPGIASEHHESIFNPFQRLSDGKKIRKSGTGLGLAFVRIVAQKHNGTVSVTNPGQKGAYFCLSLPLTTPPQDSEAPSASDE